MANTNLPLANVRIIILALTWALGTISFAANANGLVKGNQYVDTVVAAGKKIGSTVYIDNDNIKQPGYVEAAGVGSLASCAFISLALLLRDKFSSSTSSLPLSTSTLPVQGFSMLFFTIWTFACAIPKTLNIVNGEASVKAFIGTIPIPDSVVRQTEKLEGFSRVYWDRDYLRFAAIMVWPAIFFGILAITVTFIANSRKSSDSVSSFVGNGNSSDSERSSTEKAEAAA